MIMRFLGTATGAVSLILLVPLSISKAADNRAVGLAYEGLEEHLARQETVTRLDDNCGCQQDCTCCGASDSCCCNDPVWTAAAGTVILRRDGTDLFDFDYEGGVEARIMRQFQSGTQLEIVYFGIDGWEDQGQKLGNNQTQGYSSSLHSTEINLRFPWTQNISLLGGFRWIELHEDYDNAAQGSTLIDSRNVDNHMYGFQLGGNATLFDRDGPVQIYTAVKAGIYGNVADGDLFRLNQPAQSNLRRDHTSFVGQVDLGGNVQLTDHIFANAGYRLLWIEGVATADNQGAQAFSDGRLDTSGSPFYHGVYIDLGLEF